VRPAAVYAPVAALLRGRALDLAVHFRGSTGLGARTRAIRAGALNGRSEPLIFLRLTSRAIIRLLRIASELGFQDVSSLRARCSGWLGQRSARGQPSQAEVCGRCNARRGRYSGCEKFPTPAGKQLHSSVRMRPARYALLRPSGCSGRRTCVSDSDAGVVRRHGPAPHCGFRGTPGAQQASSAAAPPRVVLDSAAARRPRCFGLVCEEALECTYGSTSAAVGVQRAAASASRKPRTGRVTRLNPFI